MTALRMEASLLGSTGGTTLAAILMLVLTAVGVGIGWRLLVNPEYRSSFLARATKELTEDPLGTILAVLMVVAMLSFFWGVFIRPYGDIPIRLGSIKLDLWQASGIAFVVLLAAVLAVLRVRQK